MRSLWALTLIAVIALVTSEKDCNGSTFENVTFECQLVHNETQLSLTCTSLETHSQLNTVTHHFYIAKIFWKTLNETHSGESFRTLMQSVADVESKLYRCDQNSRNYVYVDRSVLDKHCEKFNYCLKSFMTSLNTSFVRRIEIIKAENNFALERINEFNLLTHIVIMGHRYLNVSELKLKNLHFVRTLILKGNNIEFLPDSSFSNLKKLELLDLSGNKISFISNFHFKNLINLNTLDLSDNVIHQISRDAFTQNPNLKVLFLARNNLTTMEETLMGRNTDLMQLDFSYNELKALPVYVLRNLTNLENFTCAGCHLTSVPRLLFASCFKLMYVDFGNNEINKTDRELFKNTPLLTYIDFSRNKLQEVPEFKNKTFLRFLELHHNQIKTMSKTLSKEANALYDFNLNHNKIKILTDVHVKGFKVMTKIDLSNNQITSVELGKTGTTFIRILVLRNNSIEKFDVNWYSMQHMERLIMDNNQLTTIELPPCIHTLTSQTITISLKYNNISRLDMSALLQEEKQAPTPKSKPECFFNELSKIFIDITGNSLICDCKLYPFFAYLRDNTRVKVETFLNEDNIICSSPRIIRNVSVINLSEDQLSCPIQKDCPQPCTCGVRGKDNKIFVNCSGLAMSSVPKSAPFGTTVLYFNQNLLTSMNTLNSPCWSHLSELHIDQNNLNTLSNWNIPRNLRFLSLRNINFEIIPHSLIDFVSNQSDFTLYVGGKTKICNCQMMALKKFLAENLSTVKDAYHIACEFMSNGSASFMSLHSVPDAILCPRDASSDANQTIIILCLCVGFGLMIILLLAYYKQRQLVLAFLYVHCNELFKACFAETDVDVDKIFDAFVAYSSSDRHIVMELLKELEEKEPHFHLCIHERDWMPGRLIQDNIVSSVQSSKRTIIILSDTFIASAWFALELRAAILGVSADKQNKLIVVMADRSTTLDGIDTEIRHLISKRTYLVWGERWFWKKLLYIMPRKSCSECSLSSGTEGNECCRTDSDIQLLEDH